MSGPQVLWITWLISVILLLIVGGTLMGWPVIAQKLWPWLLAPFNTRLFGTIYLSAAIPLLGYIIQPQRNLLRIILPTFTCFTTYFLLVSIGHNPSFLARKSSQIWFFLYGVDSFIGLFYCWRLRQSLWDKHVGSHRLMRLYQFQSFILGGYGLGLLFAAPIFGQTWPWPLNPFHSHLYSGVFFSGAIAMLRLSNSSNRLSRIWFGITQAFLGFMAALGTWIVDLQVHKLDWSTEAIWIWQGFFILFGALGVCVAMDRKSGK